MALKPDDFDFLSNFSTIWAIVLGSLLATVGGLAGSQIERIIERRQRERDSALLFSEIFSGLKIIIDLAHESRRVGDPYGPITMRMLRAARRELEIYDRNREDLYALTDPALRGRIHKSAVQLTMPIEGIFDSTLEIETIGAQLKAPNLPREDREELERRIARIREGRDAGFDYVAETSEQLRPLLKDLAPISGHDFERALEARRNSQ